MSSRTDHDYNYNSSVTADKEDLSKLVVKGLETSHKLLELEREIFEAEGEYLAETASDGNIVRGWEGLLTSLALEVTPDRRYRRFKPGERVFSKSSATWAGDQGPPNNKKTKKKKKSSL